MRVSVKVIDWIIDLYTIVNHGSKVRAARVGFGTGFSWLFTPTLDGAERRKVKQNIWKNIKEKSYFRFCSIIQHQLSLTKIEIGNLR